MTSLFRKIFRAPTAPRVSGEPTKEEDRSSHVPYMMSSLFYLSVILFIGLPMWFYTCSITRYSLPDLTTLESKLIHSEQSPPKLHLDLSVIQLTRNSAPNPSSISHSDDQQANYLRAHLPQELHTSIKNVTYNISWRVRRPTHDENKIFLNHQTRESAFDATNQSALVDLEQSLLRIHKSTNRFRLFLYLIDESNYQFYCDPNRPHTYTISFERFVYLCPSKALASQDNHDSLVTLIKNSLDEIYVSTVDEQKIKHILGNHLDLLFSFLPESSPSFTDTAINENLRQLSTLGDKIHQIYSKNVKDRFIELREFVTLRVVTQNVVDLLDAKLLDSFSRATNTNTTGQQLKTRAIQVDQLGKLFHSFGARQDKHSTQNVYNVLVISPGFNQSAITFQSANSLKILEGEDLFSMILPNDDKSLVLQLRGLIRRVLGMKSANICRNCHVRRDIFFNRWEMDSIMGALTLIKLQNTLTSLQSISQQVVGVKIPKEVSKMAIEAHSLALKAIELLDIKDSLESYRQASRAHELSEAAVFDPSLLESLYFPDDLKYAIYLPLFLPLTPAFYSSLSALIRYKFNK